MRLHSDQPLWVRGGEGWIDKQCCAQLCFVLPICYMFLVSHVRRVPGLPEFGFTRESVAEIKFYQN
jgi:hypothetical protein